MVRMSWKRLAKIAVPVVAALVLVLVGALVAGGWYISDILRTDGLLPDHEEPPLDMVVDLVGDGSVTLRVTAESDEDGPWTIDGLWGLVWEGGYDQVGDIVQIDGEKVLRVYEPVTGGLTPGELVRLDSYVFPEDPTRGLGILFETVSYSSPLGDFEAWLVDGSSDTWAIFVHGRTGTRRETLRMLPSFLEAGLPTLVITFRNDAGAHADPSGYYRFGQTEWIDLESAAKYAIERGAEDLILVGYSMGGGTVTNFLYQSDLANEVVGVILDAPMTNFNATVDLGAEERGLPGPLVGFAKYLAKLRFGIDWGKLDYLARADELSVPVLLFHGDKDDTVPVETSDALARARPDIVSYHRFAGASHVTSWNVDRDRYETAVAEFLQGLAD